MITIPLQALVVLCGPAGSGKSTFARRFVERHNEQGIQSTTIVSSDACRALVCDDEAVKGFDASQQAQVQRDTFELFYSIIAKRMNSRRLTIADTLSLHETARRGLLELARRLYYLHPALRTMKATRHTTPAACSCLALRPRCKSKKANSP